MRIATKAEKIETLTNLKDELANGNVSGCERKMLRQAIEALEDDIENGGVEIIQPTMH